MYFEEFIQSYNFCGFNSKKVMFLAVNPDNIESFVM